MLKKLSIFMIMLSSLITCYFLGGYLYSITAKSQSIISQNINDNSSSDNAMSITYKAKYTDSMNYKNINYKKVHISIQEFLNNLQCCNYTIKSGDTLSSICKTYESSCSLKPAIKLIKCVNNLYSINNIPSGTIIKIPETALKNGTIINITKDDSWEKICNDYYPIYDSDSIINLLVYINDLSNKTLPCDTDLFLPKI